MEVYVLKYGIFPALTFVGVFSSLRLIEDFITKDKRSWSLKTCEIDKTMVNSIVFTAVDPKLVGLK